MQNLLLLALTMGQKTLSGKSSEKKLKIRIIHRPYLEDYLVAVYLNIKCERQNWFLRELFNKILYV